MSLDRERPVPRDDGERDWCDGSELMHELGRRFQAVSVVMRRHEIASMQQICVCGELPLRVLPIFGLRCRTACEVWDLAWASTVTLATIADQQLPGANHPVGRVSGRAAVPESRGS
jgi:hypothetical protein